MDFSRDNDAQLLRYFADDEFADPALGEFLRRHADYLYGQALRSYGQQVGGPAGVEELVSTAVHKAFDWVRRHGQGNGAFDRFRGDTPDDVHCRVRLWLGRIVRNLFRDAWRSAPPEHVEVPEALAAPETAGDLSPSPNAELLQRLEEAMKSLKPEDEEAIRVSLPFYNPTTGKFELSAGEAARVAEGIGVSVDTLRQRRFRAMKRLKAAMGVESNQAKSQGVRP